MKTAISNLWGKIGPGFALAAVFGLTICICARAANDQPGDAFAQRDVLTPQQRQWLTEPGRTIRIGVTSIPPQVFRDPQTDKLSGLCIDFIRELERILATRFEVVYFGTWNEMMGAAFLRDIDIVYAAQKTPSRKTAFLFTEPYLKFDNMIVTTEEVEGPLTLSDLAGQTVAVVAGAAIEEHLRLNFPEIRLLGVDDELIGLTRVSFNQADAMVIEIARASWYIQQNKFTNLHFAGNAGYGYELGFACRSDQPELMMILNAGLGQISGQRRNELTNRWILPVERRGPDLKILLMVLGGSAVALLAAFGWNRLLTLQVRRRTRELEHELNAHQKDLATLRRYETIISLSDDQMVFIDSRGVIRAANEAYLKAVDLPRDKVIGRTSPEILGETFYTLYIRERLEAALAGKTVEYELWVEHEEKGRRYLQGIYYPHKNAAGDIEGVVLVIHDMTDIQIAQQATQASEEQLRSLFLASPVGMGLIKKRVFLSANERICEITGYSQGELIGQNARMLYVTEEDYQYVGTEKYRQIEQFGIGTVETRWRCKDGRIIDVLLSSAPIDRTNHEKGVSFTAMDITDRKAAQKALEENRQSLERLFGNLRGIVYRSKYSPEWSMEFISPGCKELTGYSAQDFYDGTALWGTMIFGQDKLLVWEGISESVKNNKTFQVEYRIRDREGRIKWFWEKGCGVFDDEGRIVAVEGFITDITDRKQAEEAREQLLRELRSKNEELESIVFIASHDLRSPLVNIRGFAGELEKSFKEIRGILSEASLSDQIDRKLEIPLSSDIPESLRFINNSSQKMETLLNGLLRLSRIGTAQINPISINMDQLAGGIIGGLGFKIRENHIDIAVEGQLPGCRGDITLINQVFVNLIDNAIKYRHPERPCQIRIRGRKRDGQSVFEIQDNGIGIPMEHKEKVFEIFHQLNPGSGGDGLGLTIVRRVLERQDGTIQIDSSLEAGTTVIVTLPSA